jgi:methionyl-tRNA formyltransferase
VSRARWAVFAYHTIGARALEALLACGTSRAIEITSDDSAFTLYERTIKTGVELLVETYPAVIDRTAPRTPQDASLATTMPRRRPEDGRIDWSWQADRIFNMIRAVAYPNPGAFVGDGAARLYLWAASLEPGAAASAEAGTIVEVAPARGVVVATGEGSLLLTQVQAAGGVAEPADRWAACHAVRVGTRL